jgi:hypothetical protein
MATGDNNDGDCGTGGEVDNDGDNDNLRQQQDMTIKVEDSDGVVVDDHILDQENNINDKEGHLAIRSIVATSAPPLMEERKTKGNSKLVSNYDNDNDDNNNDDDNNDDNKRYSQQLFLGARAHNLVRSATLSWTVH